MTRPAGSDALIAQVKLARDPISDSRINQQISKLVYDNSTVIPHWLNPRIVILDNSVRDAGWFINGDSINHKFGYSTWLKK
jgi:ABC-type oligopeptide transport system substrate-binding subunit